MAGHESPTFEAPRKKHRLAKVLAVVGLISEPGVAHAQGAPISYEAQENSATIFSYVRGQVILANQEAIKSMRVLKNETSDPTKLSQGREYILDLWKSAMQYSAIEGRERLLRAGYKADGPEIGQLVKICTPPFPI